MRGGGGGGGSGSIGSTGYQQALQGAGNLLLHLCNALLQGMDHFLPPLQLKTDGLELLLVGSQLDTLGLKLISIALQHLVFLWVCASVYVYRSNGLPRVLAS